MSRTVVKSCRWISLLAGLACVLAIPAWSVQVATPQNTPKRVFKVCMLLLPSQKGGVSKVPYWNPDPWILPVLNSSPYKPAGWVLDNPLAPGALPTPLDADLLKSGQGYASDGKGAGQNWYTNGKTAGAALTKDDPAYWVVKLDQKSLDALAQFDLLIVNGHNESTLTNADRDNLRILLDRGATIWLNNSQRSGLQVTNFFLDPPISFNPGPYDVSLNNPTAPIVHLAGYDFSSWLLQNVYTLSPSEIDYLRDSISDKSYLRTGIGSGSLMGEVVRLYAQNRQTNAVTTHTAIAAGRVGSGQLIVTGTDVIGATSDWWEYLHNHNTALWTASTLGTVPSSNTSASNNPSQQQSYISCCKFIFNMLSRPTSWQMVGGDTDASRFFPQSFATSLMRAWSTPFVTLSDPVAYGSYMAVTGASGGQSQLRIYQMNGVTSTAAMSLLGNPIVPPGGGSWIGSPVINRRMPQNSTVPQTTVIGLEGIRGASTWSVRAQCYALTNTTQPIWSSQPITTDCPVSSSPTSSMTLSNSRLVVTVFGRTTTDSADRIYLVDANNGVLRVALGVTPEWGAHFRLTGPASIISAQVDFLVAPQEAGDTAGMSGSTMERRRETVELLAAAGEYYPNLVLTTGAVQQNTATSGQSALFLIPPMAVVATGASGRSALYSTPTSLSLQTTSGKYNIGMLGNAFRRKNIVAVKTGSGLIKLTFRNWDIFFPKGSSPAPELPMPFSVSYTATTVGAQQATATQGITTQTVPNVQLTMGYPILLRGTQQNPTLKSYPVAPERVIADGDADSFFGYMVSAPPVVSGDKIIVGTNSGKKSAIPLLQNSRTPNYQALNLPEVVVGGSLSAYHISDSGFSSTTAPKSNPTGDVAWRFYGNTLGPASTYYGDYAAFAWSGNLPALWSSDFPFPAAVGHDAVYAAATYNCYSTVSGVTDELYQAVNLTAGGRGMLYALDPAPSRYLEQTVAAGTAVTWVSATQLQMQQTMVGPLRVGARALIKNSQFVWDMGRITLIRAVAGQANTYTVTFDRSCPGQVPADSTLLVATSTPYLSHVQAWNTLSGAEPVRVYHLGGAEAVRVSEGVCDPYPSPAGLAADTSSGKQVETRISFTHLNETCHDPVSTQALGASLGQTIDLQDSVFAPDTDAISYLQLPRIPQGSTAATSANAVTTATVTGGAVNYTVDYRTGRIQLSPETAGQYADRFVVAQYYTNDFVGGTTRKVLHAEVMHIPSPVLWQYEFPDAIPDSGPVVVNNTIYVAAQRKVTGGWQSTLYGFAAAPQNPMDVQPIWQQAVGPISTGEQPYRGVTTPTPVANGIVVGTAMPGAAQNELALYTDRGTLIADGHRLLRINADGDVTWQASATKAYDPAAKAADTVNAQNSVVQQGFTLITRMQRLENGNILVCDTGANRVVEMDHDGTVIWQYPDNDDEVTPAALRLNGPRDMRRYIAADQRVDIGNAGAANATLRREVTLIADAGNNRILEIYRPLVSFDLANTQNNQFTYQPNLGDAYKQTTKVLVNGAKLKTALGDALAGPVTLTLAMRYKGEDNTQQSTVNGDGIHSCQLLAVIGNPMKASKSKDSLRTVVLTRKSTAALDNTTDDSANWVIGEENPLPVRTGKPYDFQFVRQLDLVVLDAGGNTPAVHALVVDQSGVREINLADGNAIFEMTQSQYQNALGALVAANPSSDRLKAWCADRLFAPVAVMRIDAGNNLVSEQRNVRYLISQMNTVANPNAVTWGTDPATNQLAAQRRIGLFEARYLGDAVGVYQSLNWGIMDPNQNYYLYPDPLSPDYPNLPGATYPLTQPLCIDRD